jgi:hypothetical protein
MRFPEHCFKLCANLRSVSIPKSVRFIGKCCFEKCSELTEVNFKSPSAIHTIKYRAFADCVRLTDFIVPASVSTFGMFVFDGCSGLSSVTFETPSQLTNLSIGIFSSCRLLKGLRLPDSIKTVTASPFVDSGITSVAGANCLMCGSLFVHFETVVRCFGEPSSIVIPSTVREIGSGAFHSVKSIRDLRFEEGLVRIQRHAFSLCGVFENAAFPASLEVIDKYAFYESSLRSVTFAVGSRLRCICRMAFSSCELEKVILPAGVREIHPSAFEYDVWRRLIKYPVLAKNDCVFSSDSRILLQYFPEDRPLVIPARTEVIGHCACRGVEFVGMELERGTRLREISKKAFFWCLGIGTFIVPSSVETIGDRCFARCTRMRGIRFEESSRLKRIGEGAFLNCQLVSIIIPALVEELDGSAFAGCPLLVIEVAAGNRHFKIERNLLTTADGTKAVRYFGRAREVIVAKTVEIVGRSCFESSSPIESVIFDNGSILKRIGPSAFSGCEFVTSITIPSSVEIIDDSAFKKCDGLEEFFICEDAHLVEIGCKAFSGCCSLRSFYFPRNVERIGKKCFGKCNPLHRLLFESDGSLKNILGDMTLNEGLEYFGFTEPSSLLRIEVDDRGMDLSFSGWVSVGDRDSTLVLVQANE